MIGKKKGKVGERVVADDFGLSEPFHDKIVRSNKFMKLLSGKADIRVATALVYERVGDTEFFLGGYPLFRGKYSEIGEYFVLDKPGKPYFVDCLSSDVFVPAKDPVLGKVVEFVKFSEDDFRVRRRLSSSFFCKEERVVYDDKLVVLSDELGNPVIGDDDEPVMVKVPLKDGSGGVVRESVERRYSEPKGVTQEGRDAIRIHNQTSEEIKKFRQKNLGFWDKFSQNGGMFIVGMAILLIASIMMFKFQADTWSAGVSSLTGEIKDASENIKWWQQPDALDKIGGAVAKAQDEKDAPPVK